MSMMLKQTAGRIVFALLFCLSGNVLAEDIYLSVPDFMAQEFGDTVPSPAMLWLDEAQREEARTLSDEDPGFRQRYWRSDEKSAWVINVIGRDHPITLGISVKDGKIAALRVLIYRESRGWEVRHPFFTRQFDQAAMDNGKLDRDIDNITGATLSVNALQRAAKLALWLDRQLPQE
ncbi:MAG: FMN-binding protein [Pseudomonadales bacterium]|nr:FMN-binding protein [Pseudomonadales bacterium]